MAVSAKSGKGMQLSATRFVLKPDHFPGTGIRGTPAGYFQSERIEATREGTSDDWTKRREPFTGHHEPQTLLEP